MKEKKEILLNPKLYPLEVIYSAAYVFLDRAYIRLDGDPKTEIKVTMTSKEEDCEQIAKEFQNELINYGDYLNRSTATKGIRQALMQKALLINDPAVVDATPLKENTDAFNKLLDEIDDDYLDDPEGIAIPWEEKYGKDKSK